MHRMYILFDSFPSRCNFTPLIYFWKTALHVSGGIPIHHQEHIQLYLQYMVPDTVNTFVCAPDDGWGSRPKHVEKFSRNK